MQRFSWQVYPRLALSLGDLQPILNRLSGAATTPNDDAKVQDLWLCHHVFSWLCFSVPQPLKRGMLCPESLCTQVRQIQLLARDHSAIGKEPVTGVTQFNCKSVKGIENENESKKDTAPANKFNLLPCSCPNVSNFTTA